MAEVTHLQVAAANEDGDETEAGTVLLTSAASTLNGKTSGTNKNYWVGRFASVAIPRDAVILKATLSVFTNSIGKTAMKATVLVSAEDSAKALPTTSHGLSEGMAWNKDFTNWEATLKANTYSSFSTGLAEIVQKTVNRDGWASGNALAVQLHIAGEAALFTVENFDGSAEHAATLDIEWEPAHVLPLIVPRLAVHRAAVR